MTNAEVIRKLRIEAVAAGRCQECRCRPARIGFKSCEVCTERRHKLSAERYVRKGKRCQDCGGALGERAGMQNCPDCAD